MAENRTKIIIETDAGRSEQVLRNVQKGLQGVGSDADKAGQKVSAGAGLMDSALAKSALSFAAFTVAAKSAFNLAKEGAQLADARHNIQLTAAEIGISYERIEKAVRSGSNGVVGDLALLQQSHKALKLGVTKDVDELGRLWAVAEALSGDFGQTTEQTFEQITKAISEGNSKALISMGLLPESFKRASDAGTLLQKRGELLRDVLTQTSDRVKILNDNGDTAADKFDQLDASIENVKLQLGELSASAFRPFVDDLRQEVIPALSDFLKYIKEVSQELGGFNQDTARMFKQQGLAGEFGEKQRLIDEAKQRQAGLDKVLNQTFGSLTSYDQQRFGQNYAGNRNASVEEIRKAIFKESAKIDAELLQLQKELDATRNKMFVESTFKSAETELKVDEEALATLDRLSEEIEKADEKARRASSGVRTLKTDFADLGRSAVKDLESIGDEFDVFADDMDKVLDDFSDGLNDIQKIRQEAAKEAEEAIRTNYRNLKNLDPNTAQWGLMNWASSGYLNAGTDGEPLLQFQSKDKQELQNTIADAVTAGFANADFSSLELTLGNILSSVLSKSVATSNPVVDAATGAVNWGNLGINLAVNAATKVLTRPGRFFGGREEHNKEAIQQAADLKGRMGQEYVDSFVSEITSVFATRAMKDAIANARLGYSGTQTGYTWSDSGNGWTSDRTRTYAMIDNGASAALKKLTDAVRAAETFSENQEAWINLQAAKGYEYSALQAKVDAYKESLTSVYFGQQDLRWSDGSVNEGQNLTVITREIESTLAEMVRELGAATAERFTAAASGFSKYAPWLQNFAMPAMMPGQNGAGGTAAMYDSFDYYLNPASSLSRDQQYDAFEKLQNDFADRNVNGGLLQMIKEAGSGRYELEKLRVTGSEDYAEAYADYLDKQISAIEEVMERQEEIFKDATRTFEEQSAALANYEAAQGSYYQAKLDSLAAEQAAEEAIKQKQQEADLRKAERMEAALSLVGEVAQRGDKIVILQGGDSTTALKELLEKFSDDPEVSAILQAAITNSEAKARWGN